jgi:hypothetical protein
MEDFGSGEVGVSTKSQRLQQIRDRCREKKSQHSSSLGNKRDFSDELEHWNSGFLRDTARDWLEAVGFSCYFLFCASAQRRKRILVN